MIRTLIFDWDGTLHNTEALYGAAFRKAYSYLTDNGYAPPRTYTDREVSVYLGMNVVTMWNTFMPQLPEDVKRTASEIITESEIEDIRGGRAKLYTGARETLETLKRRGYRLVFLSNCKRVYMNAHREFFALDKYFDGFYCCQDYDFKPKREIFSCIKEKYPAEYVLIGDRYSDIEAALEHGAYSIGCSYGFGAAEELEQAYILADDVRELSNIIENLSGNANKIG